MVFPALHRAPAGAGEIVLFDRSWYNRAGVERVMGYATSDEVEAFLAAAPVFEKLLTDDGILLFKYWLCCDQEKQEERFAERREDPLKGWKLSPVDVAAREKYDDYTKAREAMLKATHTQQCAVDAGRFQRPEDRPADVIRDLLDRVPDTHVEEEPVGFPPLGGEPSEERYAAIEPSKSYDI